MIEAILSGIVGAIFGATLTFLAAQRKLRADNVTVERSKWRDKVRKIARDLHQADAHENDALWRDLALNLNPFDNEDRRLLALARKFPRESSDVEELTERFALLLKHDWDRAKRESSWWPIWPTKKAERKLISSERHSAIQG